MTKEVIDISRPLLVRASAGTGKTFQLSSWYIHLLLLGESVRRIMATTFTRKAAGEIRQRVFLRIAQAGASVEEAKSLSKIQNKDLSPADYQALLRRLTKEQPFLQIGTLDKFFVRTAKLFSSELGLQGDWQITNQAQENRLQASALRELIRRAPTAQLQELLAVLSQGDVKSTVLNRLKSEVRAFYQVYLESSPGAWQWLDIPKGLGEKEFRKALGEVHDLEVPVTAKGTKNKVWQRSFEELCSNLEEKNWREFLKNGLVKKILSAEPSFSRKEIPTDFAAAVQALATNAREELLTQFVASQGALYQLLETYHEALQRVRGRYGLYSFDDMKRVLFAATILGDLDRFYLRSDTEIGHILLDEFQDTSRAEWIVIEPLIENILSQAGDGERSFFCVGDVKQAIYGWRGGVAEIFDYLTEQWPHIATQSKEKSYRCPPAVLSLVNKIFPQLSQVPQLEEYQAAIAEWTKRFSPHEAMNTQYEGYACIELLEEDAEDASATYIRRTVEIVEELLERAPGVTIGVLVRRNAFVAQVMYELKVRGIPASEEGGNPLTDSPAVMAVLSLLSLAEHPADTICRFHVAKSPIGEVFGYENYELDAEAFRVAQAVLEQMSEQGLRLTLEAIVESIASRVEARDRRRLQQLITLAQRFESRPFSRLSEFVQFVSAERVEDPASTQVQVMTVHKAKGLEFDAVILPELEESLVGKAFDAVLCERSQPMAPPTRVSKHPSQELRLLEPELESMYQDAVAGKVKEALSVLYVALTRPRYALYGLVKQPGEKKTAAKTFGAALRESLFAASEEENKEAPQFPDLFEEGDPSWYKKFPAAPEAGKHDGKKGAPKKIVFQKKRARYLPFVQPSKLHSQDGAHQAVASIFEKAPDESIARGRILHALLEKVLWLEEGVPEGLDVATSLARFGVKEGEGAGWYERFQKLLAQPNLARLLSVEFYQEFSSLHVYPEFSFVVRRDDSLLRGVVDRLVIGEAQGQKRAHIIDFKSTGQRLGTDELHARSQLYAEQLEAYAFAVGKMFQLEAQNIDTSLFFLENDTEVRG